MKKKMWLGFIVVFIVFEILDYLLYTVILGSTMAEVKVFRADMQRLWWVYPVITLIGSFFFSFIFSKGYEGKGIAEGIRYGTYIGIWMSVGMAYGTYAMIDIPYKLALQWFIYGIIEYIIGGIVLALVFKSKPAQPAKP
jgi:hypothetical protein